jgi:hypothetical protein
MYPGLAILTDFCVADDRSEELLLNKWPRRNFGVKGVVAFFGSFNGVLTGILLLLLIEPPGFGVVTFSLLVGL